MLSPSKIDLFQVPTYLTFLDLSLEINCPKLPVVWARLNGNIQICLSAMKVYQISLKYYLPMIHNRVQSQWCKTSIYSLQRENYRCSILEPSWSELAHVTTDWQLLASPSVLAVSTSDLCVPALRDREPVCLKTAVGLTEQQRFQTLSWFQYRGLSGSRCEPPVYSSHAFWTRSLSCELQWARGVCSCAAYDSFGFCFSE